jgi:CRP/FNR family transcriptional regulator, cyclic AMP receptor protein
VAIDPLIIQSVAQSMRAEILPRAQVTRLDPNIVEKIARKVPIFSGMSLPCLMNTLGDAEHVPVKVGQSVFLEGERGRFFFVLIAGDVMVEKMRDGRTFELARLGPGECFGEMALVGKQVRSASVRALNEVIAMRFDPLLIEANPESAHIIYRNIAHILASRLDDSSMMLADLAALRFGKTQST